MTSEKISVWLKKLRYATSESIAALQPCAALCGRCGESGVCDGVGCVEHAELLYILWRGSAVALGLIDWGG
jgi:hypothetical protein